MRKVSFRLFSLMLLAALLCGSVPALAAAKPALKVPELFWQGDWVKVEVTNLPKGAAITSVKSAKPSIIQVIDGDAERPFFLHGLKGGRSKITVRYRLKSGATRSVAATVTVKKYPNAIKSIKLNGKALPIKPAENIEYQIQGYKKTATTVRIAPNTGWKVDRITLFMEDGQGQVKNLDLTKKNGRSVATPKRYTVLQYLFLLRDAKGQIYHSVLTLFRN